MQSFHLLGACMAPRSHLRQPAPMVAHAKLVIDRLLQVAWNLSAVQEHNRLMYSLMHSQMYSPMYRAK